METSTSAPSVTIRIIPPTSSEKADLGIVTVNWKVKDLLMQNLETVYHCIGNISVRIIMVDNGSNDGSIEEIPARYPEVITIGNTKNLGFAKAVNQGIKVANARHVLLLNPDMRVTLDAFAKTVEYLDQHPDVGVLGGRLIGSDGKTYPSVRRFPDVWSQLALLLKIPHLFPSVLDMYMWKDFDYEKEQSVPSIRGSYFAMSKTALEKLGGLDELFFIWFEEVDYCKQVVEAGMKVMYVPSIQAHDLVGRSFAQRKTLWKQKNFTRSMSQYFWKWQPGWRAALISLVRPLPIAAAWISDFFIS